MAGIKKHAPFHATRHTAITYMLALGMSEAEVKCIVGHVKSETIAGYTHMDEEMLQQAPQNALARHLPGYGIEQKENSLVRQLAEWLAGEREGVDRHKDSAPLEFVH